MFFYNEQSLEIVTEGLQLHLDAGDTNSYSGTGTTWFDLSGNGNNAELVSNPIFTNLNGGEFGAFGTYGSGGYARINHSTSIAPTSQLTLSSWAYADDWNNSASGFFVSKAQSGGYSLGIEPNGIVAYLAIQSSYKRIQHLSSSGWHNITLTYNGSALILYVDGVAVATSSATGNITYSVSNALLIGREADAGTTPTPGYDWPGKVATLMLYDRSITSAEVLQNFEATKTRFGL